MTIDLTPFLGGHGPKYLSIARALAEAVRHGVLSPGMRLPTHRELAETLLGGGLGPYGFLFAYIVGILAKVDEAASETGLVFQAKMRHVSLSMKR